MSLVHQRCVCCLHNNLTLLQRDHQQVLVFTRSLWTNMWSSWKRVLLELWSFWTHFRRETSGKSRWAALLTAVNGWGLEAPPTKCREHQSSSWLQYEDRQVRYLLPHCQPPAPLTHWVFTRLSVKRKHKCLGVHTAHRRHGSTESPRFSWCVQVPPPDQDSSTVRSLTPIVPRWSKRKEKDVRKRSSCSSRRRPG